MELGAFSTVLLWSGDGEEEKRGGAASGESEVDPCDELGRLLLSGFI